jgi:hypothetical protein
MTPGVGAGLDAPAAPEYYGVPAGTTIGWSAIRTYEHEDAPAAAGRYPVLLCSPSVGDVRSSAVQFPGDRVVLSNLPDWITKAQQNGTITQLLKRRGRADRHEPLPRRRTRPEQAVPAAGQPGPGRVHRGGRSVLRGRARPQHRLA